MADISKEQVIELARAAGVVDGPKILMMATHDELHRFAQAAYKLGRNSVVDEAKRAIQESSSPFKDAARKPLTDAQIEEGRKAIFSTGNPFCPCDSGTMRKVVQWTQRKHGITGEPK